MIIADAALEKREREGAPIRVGIVGAGYIARGIVSQLLKPPVGIRLAAISNRTLSRAETVLRDCGLDQFSIGSSVSEVESQISRGRVSVTDDPSFLCDASNVDVIIEATSDMEYGAKVVLGAIEGRKHVVLLNAALDSTVGPFLKLLADRKNVVITYTDGEEPGVAMNLFRFVKTIGYKPVGAGNIKGLLDHYRNPDTQKAFAARIKASPLMVTSFADGTKLAMECTILANSTGLRVGRRGMYGPTCAHVNEICHLLPQDQLLNGGLVDFVLGAQPHTGAFVIGYNENPINKEYMNAFKMGDGPFYVFYTPYHLPQLQINHTIARAALFHDPTTAPIGKPVCEVLSVAKRDLSGGEVLDGIGGFACYGLIENSDVAQSQRALPMGLSEGCRLKHSIKVDQIITYDDVLIPTGRLCDKLRAEQDQYFSSTVTV